MRALILLAAVLVGSGQALACATPTCCLVAMSCADDDGTGSAMQQGTLCAGACLAAIPAAAVTGLPPAVASAPGPAVLLLSDGRSIPPATPPPDFAARQPV